MYKGCAQNCMQKGMPLERIENFMHALVHWHLFLLVHVGTMHMLHSKFMLNLKCVFLALAWNDFHKSPHGCNLPSPTCILSHSMHQKPGLFQ